MKCEVQCKRIGGKVFKNALMFFSSYFKDS
jgi:hypothetical protein